MRNGNRITNEKAVITHVVRYVNVNTHVPKKMWDTDGGMEERMYAVWMLDNDANTMVSFIKRNNQSLGQAVRDGVREVYKVDRVDDQEFNLGTIVNIKSANIKKRYPAEEHKGKQLPTRDVLTHVIIG